MNPEILAYARERYSEEHQRFDYIEQKCGLILGFVTVVFTILVGIITFYSETIFAPSGVLDWAVLINVIILGFVLVCAWGHSLLSIKLGGVHYATKKQEAIDHMLSLDDEKLYDYMLRCYVNPTNKLTPVIDEKAKYLRYSYESLVISGFLIFTLLVLNLIKEFSKC